MHPGAAVLLTLVFFASGFSALVFETLWFSRAGLTFGGSVTTSALVLSSFMGGMAFGNGLAARFGHRIRAPIRAYAALEVAIGISGLTLVWLLPHATSLFAVVLRPLLDSAPLLHAARFAAAFALLSLPAIAMGATLPVLVKAFAPSSGDFGRVLGWLYGCNTLGAVVGAVTSETLWIPIAGVLGSGFLAACVDGIAAGLALWAARLAPPTTDSSTQTAPARERLQPRGWLLLFAAFLSGATLLALEIVWFRMNTLLVPQTSVVFGWMLGVVLLGLAVGSLLAAALLRVRPDLDRFTGAVAFVSGIAVVQCYAAYPAAAVRFASRNVEDPFSVMMLSVVLMLPTSLLSGVIFTWLGRRIRAELATDIRSAGLLTLFNTLGSMLGPLAASFVLLPRIGVERTVWLLAAAYGVVGACALLAPARGGADPVARPQRSGRIAQLTAAGLFAFTLASFPFGLMAGVYKWQLRTIATGNEQRVALYEGVNETIVYTRATFLDETYYYRLITDGYSMSGTGGPAQRYMGLFADLPYAFLPRPRDALLISYGVGITANALLSDPQLESLDVVDISRDILRMSSEIVSGGRGPLADPRVRVHVEDGRYFLQITDRLYDVITGEPPPPAAAGVVNLYTQEYFSLMRARLRPGGIASYWLPVGQLAEAEAKAIVGAFCTAFPDCSLWEGTPIDWILLGTADASTPLEEDAIHRPWTEPPRRERLRAIGVEKPEQLAALFLADSDFLNAWSGSEPPLVDNWPGRAPRWRLPWKVAPDHYAAIMEGASARKRFESSRFIERLWPALLRERSLRYFRVQQTAREFMLNPNTPLKMYDLHRLLTETDLETVPLWLAISDWDRQRIVELGERGEPARQNVIAYHLGARALVRRDYATAAEQFHRSGSALPEGPQLALYALAMAGRPDEVAERSREARLSKDAQASDRSFWSFMSGTFGIQPQPPL